MLMLKAHQLKPVKGRFSFEQPSCEDYHLAYQLESLWKSFQVINLTENHRQGKDKTYADILNRVKVGEQTQEDIELLRTQVCPYIKLYHLYPQTCIPLHPLPSN